MGQSELSAYERWELPLVSDPDPIAEAKKQGGSQSLDELKNSNLLTQQQIDSIVEQAREEGYQTGFKSGKHDLEAHLQTIEDMIERLNQPMLLLTDTVEQALVTLVKAIARNVIHREIQTNPEHILKVVKGAKNLLPVVNEDITLIIHPEDFALLPEKIIKKWQIEEDSSIERGGCYLETKTSRIHATLQSQIDHVFNQVFGEL